MDQRLEKLEETMESYAGHGELLRNLADMLKKLNTRVEDATQTSEAINDSATHTLNSSAIDGQPTARRNVNDGTSNSQVALFMPKTVKIDFPRYHDKSDPTDFKDGLNSRYRPNQYLDFFGKLTWLQCNKQVQCRNTRTKLRSCWLRLDHCNMQDSDLAMDAFTRLKKAQFEAFVDSINHNGSLTTMALQVNRVDFVAEYKSGRENVVADSLSRRHDKEDNNREIYAFSQPLPKWIEAIKEEIQSNSELQKLVQLVKDG
ncbi:hypothetical protein EZV62_018097 [Acer yangbiense]|uniref:Uncharacterized protein n=1 Tax=Acer yangbiense TaxID=1000413 RepID=A0A5C7HIU2_9ROSI|nr:hypothetical protein EZV62_018097 [Acer yangbiense]